MSRGDTLKGDFDRDCLGNKRRGEGEGRPGDVGIGYEARVALLAPFEVLLGIINRRRRWNA